MAYQQHHDPYYNQQQHYNGANIVPDGPPMQQYNQTPASSYHGHDNYDQQWDAKSYNSQYGGSQAHLNPHYDPNPLPMPAMGYHQNQNYPPQQYPQRQGIMRGASTGSYTAQQEKILRRRSVRQVALQQGNLVLDVAVPSHLVPPGCTNEEQTHLRYTAATCDPDDFMRSKYTLRPYLLGRHTELFIVMTMYNEDDVLFCKTMNAVIKNVAHLCSRSASKMWGPNGWQKVVVCVVSDGRSKVNRRTLHVLSLMGCYIDGIAKDTVSGKDVTAHIFEYTTNAIVTDTGEVSKGACPVQVIFCLKEQNKKKLNSHRWFFNAFGPLIKPNVCVLLDVGTKPTGTSIYELWKAFDKHSNVGGACGEICVDTGRGCGLLLTNPLAASQNFEYKISNILDKPLESVFGYISVLPGAFSAYRYKALQGKPLNQYFKGETLHGDGADGAGLFERNMYLAEDRILCFEIVTKKNEGWVLRYVKSAKASTDVPATLPEFISQRRRWLNGSFFASVHATVFFFKIWTSGQNFFRKIILQIEFIYNAVQLFFSWTSLANFYLAFFFLVSSASKDGDNSAFGWISDESGVGTTIFEVFLKLYIALLFIVVVCSLGNRPQGSKWTYTLCVVLFGICNVITLYCAGFTVYSAVPHTIEGWKNIGELIKTNKTFREIVISIAATYGLYFGASFMHLEPWHMFTSFLQYLFLLPSYVNILMTYAMCNLHDVSWGTKGDNGAAKDLGSAKKVKGEDGKEMMEVELPTAKEDVEQLWNASRSALRNKPAEQKEHRDAATKQSDRDRNSRTNVVIAWVGTNMLMILVFTSQAFTKWVATHVQTTQDSTFNPYLSFLFMALAGLSAFRFAGSFLYLVFRLVGF